MHQRQAENLTEGFPRYIILRGQIRLGGGKGDLGHDSRIRNHPLPCIKRFDLIRGLIINVPVIGNTWRETGDVGSSP